MSLEVLEKVAFNQLNALLDDFPGSIKDSYELQNITNINRVAMSFIQEMDNIGFTFTIDAIKYLSKLSEDTIKDKCVRWLQIAKRLLGDHVEHEPFYPNFPQQVIDADDFALFVNSITHYFSGGHWRPPYEKEKRTKLEDKNTNKKLSVVGINDLKEFYYKILSSKESIPSTLDAFVDYAIDNCWTVSFKEEIPFKETLSRIAAAQVKKGELITGLVKTTTDILRVMANLSGYKSLKEKIRFKSLKRKFRRIIVAALEPVINISDVKAYKGLWILAFHSLHVGEFGGEVARIAKLFRNESNVVTFETEVCEAVKAHQVVVAAEKLCLKPSVFARSLDKLVRDADSQKDIGAILDIFFKVVSKVSSKILIQLFGHFKGRDYKTGYKRIIQTAGSKSVSIIAPPLPPMSMGPKVESDIVERIMDIITSEIKNQFSLKKNIKSGSKVFISPDVESILLPTQMASISSTKKSIARGSQVPFKYDETDDGKGILRLFVYWIGLDVDLSAMMINSDFSESKGVSYTTLKLSDVVVHSGDITYAPDGASEFIDINIKKLIDMGYQYILLDVRSFSQVPFNKLKECFTGFMLRDELGSGEVFEAKTVKMKIDLILESIMTSPCLFDIINSTIVWIDSNLHSLKGCNSLDGNSTAPMELAKYHLKMKDLKMTMKEFISLHVEANQALLVEEESEADFIVGLGRGDLDVYDFTEINSHWI